ncbi:hypothetical protein M433DRAFT_138497, partial [Acidomyces richmondensis BFW]
MNGQGQFMGAGSGLMYNHNNQGGGGGGGGSNSSNNIINNNNNINGGGGGGGGGGTSSSSNSNNNINNTTNANTNNINPSQFDLQNFPQGLANGTSTFQTGSLVPAKRPHDASPQQLHGSRSQTPSYPNFPNAPTPFQHLQQAPSSTATP